MNRRELMLLPFLLALVVPTGAQSAGEKLYRLGQLALSAESIEVTRSTTLPELAKLGFIEGRNLVLDERTGDRVSMPGLARSLVLSKPDAIIAIGIDAINAASEATGTIPLIAFGPDLVQAGFAASLARPGGNVTGVQIFAAELDGKRLDMLREAVPAARRIAALLLRSVPGREANEKEMRSVAANTGVELLVFEADGPDDYSAAFAAMREAGAQALIIHANPVFYRDTATLAGLALQAGLPTICQWADMAKSGCLLGYGPSRLELRLRLTHQVARIFQGAAAGDLPVEQPTKFEMAVNLKTAKALGITVPETILTRADEVIE
jgi:putative tryptophan/tyrosine transport system substrate-binding protein